MFIVIELQRTGETLAPLDFVFADYNKALEKYYKLLAVAVMSNVSIHSVSLLDEHGALLMNESFSHK